MTPLDSQKIKNSHPRILFFAGFFVFALGIACGNILDIRLALLISLAGALFLAFLSYSVWRWQILLLISLSFCGWYMGHQDLSVRQREWQILQDTTQNFSGSYTVRWTVDHLMYTSDLRSTYRLQIATIANRSTPPKSLSWSNIGILIEVPNNLHIHIGDIIEFTGKIHPLISFPIDGFSGYSWYHRVYGKGIVPVFRRITLAPDSLLDRVQSWSQWVIWKGFPEDMAGIILGMTIGNIELLSSEVKKSFTNAGITHILVVSGSNIAFVIVLLTGILRYTPIERKWRITIITIFVILYGSLVWWDMPVIRAVAMGLITYMAMEGWQRTSSTALLFLVGWCILLYSPLALIYDAGFGLSFAGTLGILLFQWSMRDMLKNRYTPSWIIDIVGVTIAASIGSIVAIIYHFGTIPLYTLISNILISGLLGWILLSSVIYLAGSILGIWFSYIWWWTIYIPTKFVMWVGSVFWANSTYVLPDVLSEPLAVGLMMFFILYILETERRKILQSK
jgi:ComEC/Rec2-related protein